MDYQIDLDPIHRVIRVTVTTETVTLELAKNIRRWLSRFPWSGSPYATILDLSKVTSCTLPSDAVRDFAGRAPVVPGGRTRVVVGKDPLVFGLARMFQQIRDFIEDFIGAPYQVVHSLEDAYEMLGVCPEDFSERIFPKDQAA